MSKEGSVLTCYREKKSANKKELWVKKRTNSLIHISVSSVAGSKQTMNGRVCV